MHQKNLQAITQYKYIDITTVSNQFEIPRDFSQYDYVYSPAILFPVKKYPKTKFIFGPHVSVFPTQNLQSIIAPNSLYIQPSEWARRAWAVSPLCRGLRLETLPFGVDTARFAPVRRAARRRAFVYFKRRQPAELSAVVDFLTAREIEVRVFDYCEKYEEREYLEFLQMDAAFGVWVGSHESQGFALLEALSCDVPLLVWDATTMAQEVGSGHPDVSATSAPYWDERCGYKFTAHYELGAAFQIFTEKLEAGAFRPREYVVENMSMDVCEMRLLQLLDGF